ncbi:hypothetical protein A33M_0421 [Rhodovulum sp. PH10]|nr:hypothetical protein A33M_0421 [Rhodovulum sp. PH10]
MLMAELERGILRGEQMPQSDLLLAHLREALWEDERVPERIGNPARLFFLPVEPFIVDDEPEHAQEGRLARAAIGPLWDWVSTDIAPAEAKIYLADVARFLLAKESAKADQAARVLQDVVVKRLEESLEAARKDDKARRRIAFRIGTPRAQDDVLEFYTILKERDALATIAGRLPTRIRSVSADQLDQVIAVLDGALARDKQLLRHALVLVMNRMPAAWHLVRVALRAVQSDKADRIAESPYGLALDMVLGDVERQVRDLVRDFRRGQMVRAIAQLKDVHEAVRGLRSEVNMVAGTPPARRLAAVRAGVADAFKSELESIPGRVRRVIRIVPGKQLPRGATIDPSEVAEIEGLLAFVAACKIYAGELALNEITLRVLSDLQSQLDNGSRSILDVLRACDQAELAYRTAQMEAATRFCAKILGEEYATLLSRAAEVAVGSERKAKSGQPAKAGQAAKSAKA